MKMEKTNNIVVMHYNKYKPEAYVWLHRDDLLRHKEFYYEQERKFVRWLFTGSIAPEPTYLEKWIKQGRDVR